MGRRHFFERHPRLTLALFACALLVGVDLGAGLLLNQTSNLRIPHPYYHHDLRPRRTVSPSFSTNSLGFRDREPREVALSPAPGVRRVLFIGDSFAESSAVDWSSSFVGKLQDALAGESIELLNAGVASYSPKLYYLKTRYLLEQVGLRFDQLVVLIDISDPQDEIIYQDFQPLVGAERLAYYARRSSFLYHHLSLIAESRGERNKWVNYEGGVFRFFSDETLALLRDKSFLLQRENWTSDPELQRRWGQRGLELGASNLERLVELCRARGIDVTLVVYPWPAQIQRREIDSLQARFWRSFAEAHRVRFVNLFPSFVPDRPDQVPEVLRRYFIAGDVHWNEAGHALVSEQLLPALRR
jgi:hypothetical protein